MYREDDYIFNLFQGEYVAVTVYEDMYIIRESSHSLWYLKNRWSYCDARYMTMNELRSLPVKGGTSCYSEE